MCVCVCVYACVCVCVCFIFTPNCVSKCVIYNKAVSVMFMHVHCSTLVQCSPVHTHVIF